MNLSNRFKKIFAHLHGQYFSGGGGKTLEIIYFLLGERKGLKGSKVDTQRPCLSWWRL